jgi:(1->4)-alpha-D-glucan 1-alpha-D-glucosylmutase
MVAAIPRATYRLQLTGDYRFRDAAELAPYLARLGISHCYFSPYLKARPGSQHGYDIVDHNALNPELGSETDYAALCDRLTEQALGQVLDIVPNHVGIMGREGKWWLSVLENGQASHYSTYFDIDWRPVSPKLRDKVLVPVLGDQYGNVLIAGEIQLDFDARSGEFSARYFEHLFPIDPGSYPRILEPGVDRLSRQSAADRAHVIELESIIRSLRALPPHTATDDEQREVRAHEAFIAKRRLAELGARSSSIAAHIADNVLILNGKPGRRASFEALHDLLERQAYRLAFWRVAADEINYRRFFDNNDHAGLSTQNEEVLEATHAKVLELAASGKVHGFRIDHPDGLYDPRGYLEWLRGRLTALGRPHHYLIVEKILGAHEHVPRGWPVHGTTGYEFTFAVNGVFVYGPGEEDFDAVYREFTRERDSYEAMLYRAKRQIVTFHLSSELTVLANLLNRIAEMRLETRDFTLNAIRAALLELVASFPVYRSYVTPDHVGNQDRAHIDWAVRTARQNYDNRDEGILELIRSLLLFELPNDAEETYRRRVAVFTAKFQQFTSPVMAKALEDTCFYRYVRLLSLNEVGSDPRRFGITPSAFHRLNELRQQYWPHSMLGTSTHDSKRSEDVRARLNVLSEMPDEWRARLLKWRRFNRTKRRKLDAKTVPSRAEEYLLYQTLLGTWPLLEREAALPHYRERIEAYLTKALREAKLDTTWAQPNAAYEERALAFVRDVLAEGTARNPFLEDLDAFVATLAEPGFLNALGQTLLKLTSPGVPDVYQGNELWDFSLVDPDNRRAVDYGRRRELLAELEAAAADPAGLPALLRDLRANLGDGRAKLFLIWRALRCRAEHHELFERGAYLPLEVRGARAEHVCAFARRHEGQTLVVAVGRWFTRLPRAEDGGGFDWGDTVVALPDHGSYRSVLTAQGFETAAEGEPSIAAQSLFTEFPVAMVLATGGRSGA